MNRISIFELERRLDFDAEFEMLYELIEETDLEVSKVHATYIIDLINDTFHSWPYGEHALNIQHYFCRLSIEFDQIDEITYDEDRMYFIDFIINYFSWLKQNKEFKQIVKSFEQNRINEIMKKIEGVISFILENLNYRIIQGKNHLYITKRDENVDSILSVVDEPDIRELMLSFYDFRIENDVDEKRIILKKLGDYLEPQRRELNTYNKNLTDDIFYILNKFYIRHNNDSNIKFEKDEDYLIWYDNLFKMIIQILRAKEIKKIQSKLVEFKK